MQKLEQRLRLPYHFGISRSFFEGSFGNEACGSTWYQYATELMSDCWGIYRQSCRHPRSWMVTFKSDLNLIGSGICQRYIPKLVVALYSPSGRITWCKPA